MGLEITSTKAQIEIVTQKAKLNIRQKKAYFRIHQTPARMKINRKNPVLHVDTTSIRAGRGLSPALMWMKQQSDSAAQACLEGIGNRSQDGDFLAQIQNKGATISALALNRSIKNVSINIAALPRPDIKWEIQNANIEWTPHKFSLEWQVENYVDIQIEPHKVEIRLKKYPQVLITYRPDNHSKTTGKIVDRYV